MSYRLLTEFEGLFSGIRYQHRDSSRGDWVAMHLYEDLLALGKSSKLKSHVNSGEWGLNASNKRVGIKARRGDGTFGEFVPGFVPGVVPIVDPSFIVPRGDVATIEVGTEVKILAKAMIKQIDRVTGDLRKQVEAFRSASGEPICVAIVGVNHAPYAVGYEGLNNDGTPRVFPTNGKNHKHPIQEAEEAILRLKRDAAPSFFEFVVLPYRATNEEPYPFSWVDAKRVSNEYGAALTRISREYDRRF